MGVMDIATEQNRSLDPSGNNVTRQQETALGQLRTRGGIQRERQRYSFGYDEAGPSVSMALTTQDMLELILLGVLAADIMLFAIFMGVML